MEDHNNSGSLTKIQVLIVEDHPLFREGLAKALSLEPDMAITGYAVSGAEAIQLARQHRPDVMLLDVNLPDINGMQVARQLTQESMGIAVVILTAYHDDQQVLYAMRAGAAAYCSKTIDPQDLVQIIRDATAGMYIVNNERMDPYQLNAWLQERIHATTHPGDDSDICYSPLSPREIEILRAVTHGLRNKEIAQQLGISQQTVKNHMTSILRKLNVGDRTEAAVTALRAGWVRLNDR